LVTFISGYIGQVCSVYPNRKTKIALSTFSCR
jgi:hypothetical protein